MIARSKTALLGRRAWRRRLLVILALALLYYLSGRASFSVAVSHGIVTLVVFAAEGFALAAAVLYGRRVWPGVFLGQLALALSNDLAWPLALGVSAINSAELVLAALLFRRLRLSRGLERMRDVLGLVLLVSLVLQPFSATLGTALLWLGGVLSGEQYPSAWLSWWLGNVMGQMLITPMVLAVLGRPRGQRMQPYEAGLILLPLLPASWLVFRGPQLGGVAAAFAVFTPLLVVMAVRRGMAAVTFGAVIIAGVALYTTRLGLGPFVRDGQPQLLDLNVFLLGTALTAQFVAVLFAERKANEEQLRLAASVFANSREAIIILDAQHGIIDVNPEFSRLFGHAREALIGCEPRSLLSPRHDEAFFRRMLAALAENEHWQGEVWLTDPQRRDLPSLASIAAVRDGAGRITHYVGVLSDIRQIKEQQAVLEALAWFDPLTGLPNRRLFDDRLRQAMAHCARAGGSIAVAFLDLDGFKPINDRYGHAVGDQVLVEVAKRLSRCLRAGETVARLGGDEFALLLLDLDSEAQCEPVLARISASLAEPMEIAGLSLSVASSLGLTRYPDDHSDADGLLRHADQAMYAAKQAGVGQWRYWAP